MDSSEADNSATRKANRSLSCTVLRWSLSLVFLVASFFAVLFLVSLAAVVLSSSSVAIPISVSSQCKIVSSSVDIRSSKVCELGLLNYKAKHVFYSFRKSKFRCRYEYYWASIFKVEYKDASSGVIRLALAEAPDEALPLDCRPNFGAAWLNKDKFKVNETYDCSYTYGVPKVSLHDDGLFRCQANDPLRFEMVKRYSILSMKMLKSWISSEGKSKYWKWDIVAGLVAGFSTSLISIFVIVIFPQIMASLPQFVLMILFSRPFRRFRRVSFAMILFVVSYIFIVSWLAFQFGKRLGILEILTDFYG